VCEKYKNSTRDEKMAMQADYDEHLLLKQEARDLKKEHKTLARSNVQFHACCFDLQQVLQCPYGANSLFYYRHKLDLYNLSVYDLATGKAKCFIWDQMQAKRGANEIGSCLHRYLTGLSEEGIREVVMYADNCGGQNKNQFIVAMMLHAVITVQHTEIEKLTICYLEAGHTQNENDSVHSSIELAKKKAGSIFVPTQYVAIVRTARKVKSPLEVEEMDQSHFFDFKQAANHFLKNRTHLADNTRVHWRNIRQLVVLKSQPFKVFLAYRHTEELREIDIRGKAKRSKASALGYQLKKAYKRPIPVPKAKKEDLLALCKAMAIPTIYHSFYEGLPCGNTVDDDSLENISCSESESD
jgi:hypothetical protein